MRLTRTVVLPDYQGVGIGVALREWVARKYANEGWRVITTLAHPALNHAMTRNPNWQLRRQGRVAATGRTSRMKMAQTSKRRLTCGWEYVGAK